MPSPVKIKIKSTIPFTLEMKLVQQYGFKVHSRKKGEWVIFAKDEWPEMELKKVGDVTPLIQASLIRRINKIVEWYADPTKHTTSIRLRLTNLAAGLDPKERQFVQDWTEQHYPAKVA